MKCWTQAKLALPTGGVPYFQRTSSRSRSPPQSLTLNGGLARMKSALQVLVQVVVEAVGVVRPEVGLDAPDRQVHLGATRLAATLA